MAEHVVEAVRLLQVVQLLGLAHPPAGREAAVGQVLEEHLVRHQAGHGDHLPAGGTHQGLVELAEVRHAVLFHAQRGQALQEFVADPALQHRRLALVQLAPDGVVGAGVAVHRLGDGEVRAQFLAGQQAGVELFLELVGQGALEGAGGFGGRGDGHRCASPCNACLLHRWQHQCGFTA
ncbi:hypothetical protein D3C72_1619600 [compost metagenome]